MAGSSAAVRAASAPEAAEQELAHRIRDRLGIVLGRPQVVDELRQLSGGASRETWSFRTRDLDAPAGPQQSRALILRRDPPTEPRPEQMRTEAAAWRAARAHGVPGPDLVDHGDAALGAPYLVVTFVPGETIPRRILRDQEYAGCRPGLTAELGRVAAGIHDVAADEVPDVPTQDFLEEHWDRYRSTRADRPVLDLALRWLADTRPPPPERAGLVHGDFRLGNVIVGPEGVRAVLDWEFAHRGDPMEDLGWLCMRAWRFGGPGPVAGLGTFDDLFDGYASVAGVRPDPELVRWWQVAATLSWGIGCLVQSDRHLSGTTRSLELAAVGRRVCEQEHDLLRMLAPLTPAAASVARRVG